MTIFRAIGASAGTPKSMYACCTSAERGMSFETPAGTDYQVPVGKVLKVTRLLGESGAAGFHFGYGDDGIPVQVNPPTNPVYLMGNGVGGAGFTLALDTPIDVYIEIPAEKYPFMEATGAVARCLLMGVEEDA